MATEPTTSGTVSTLNIYTREGTKWACRFAGGTSWILSEENADHHTSWLVFVSSVADLRALRDTITDALAEAFRTSPERIEVLRGLETMAGVPYGGGALGGLSVDQGAALLAEIKKARQ